MTTRPPRVEDHPRTTTYETGDDAALSPDASVEMTSFRDLDLTDRDLMGVALTDCEVRSVIFDGADLSASRIADSVLTQLQVGRLSLPRSTLRNLHMSRCRFGALDMFDARVRGMVVEGCKVDLLNLRGADVRDVLFRDCTVGEIDLGDAALSRLAFEDCTVGAIDVHRAKLTDLDLRGARVGTLRHLDGLSGTTIDGEQLIGFAGLFAAHLGVEVD
ncbi:pentapeptide repeat-containing protein [Gordonia sp. VNQ95]|jgi:uncharacterized protein YjbI with pentapeptide repeats|uniref:pentapeptide repeat-containing protein n=1 Tax=Gordonia TaxID=2053 RepID=UPI0032B32819